MRRSMKLMGLSFAIVCGMLATAAPAAAQTGRVVLSVNGISQSGTETVSGNSTFTTNAESGSFTSTFPVKSGPGFDASLTIGLKGPFGLSIGGTSFKATGSADVSAKVPHPFFFNQPRTVTGTVSMTREETTARLALTLSSAPGGRFQFSAYAGPAYVSVKQDLVDAVTFTDSYPYDTATFKAANTSQPSKTAVGFAGGADASFYFTKSIGIGLSASVVSATINFSTVDNTTVAVKAGGTQVGGGLRIRF